MTTSSPARELISQHLPAVLGELAASGQRASFGGAAPGAVRLDVRPGPEPFRVDVADLLVDVDAALPLVDVATFCADRGLVFPLLLASPAAPPGLTVAQALWHLAPFTDAFVEGVVGCTASGRPLATPRAPRAAVGPDLVGGLSLAAPLVVPLRARLRVFAAEKVRVRTERHPSERAAAARVLALLDEGRAFVVEAEGAVVRIVGAHLPALDEGTLGPAGYAVGECLAAPTAASLAEHLRTARVLAAPYLARVGVLRAGSPAPVVVGTPQDAAARLADALAGAFARGGPRGP